MSSNTDFCLCFDSNMSNRIAPNVKWKQALPPTMSDMGTGHLVLKIAPVACAFWQRYCERKVLTSEVHGFCWMAGLEINRGHWPHGALLIGLMPLYALRFFFHVLHLRVGVHDIH
jgi:hypothetical protein